MKKTGLFTVLFILCLHCSSQEKLTPEAETYYSNAMSTINSGHITWIRRTSMIANREELNKTDIRNYAKSYGTANKLSEMDIEGLIVLVLIQSAKDNEGQMRIMIDDIKKRNVEKHKINSVNVKLKDSKGNKSPELDSARMLLRSDIRPMIISKQVNTTAEQSQTESPKALTNKKAPSEIKLVSDSLTARVQTLAEMNELTNLRLNNQMDRQNKAFTMISNIMKKISDSQSTIIQNLK